MLKATSSIVNVSQIVGVLPVVNGGTGVTTSTGTGSTVLSAAPTLSGNVTLSTGNLIVASGQGIDFSATPGTGTSELLADYEEGTWTPVISFGGASTGITYDAQSGWYTRVGNLVTVQCIVFMSSKGSSTGNVEISGLPFATTGNNFKRNGGYGFFDRVTPCQVLTNSAATTFTLNTLSIGVVSSSATLTDADFANNSYMSITFSYFA